MRNTTYRNLTTGLLAAAAVAVAGVAWVASPSHSMAESAAAEAIEQQQYDRLFWPEVGTIPTVEVEDIDRIVKNHDSELLVVNLWASWCAPCVAELPYFQAAHEEFAEQGVRMVGIGDDYSVYGADWMTYAKAVIERRGVTYPNYQVTSDPQDVNEYFSNDWSGALPATFFYNSEGEKVAQFYGEVSRDDLFAAIRNALGIEEEAEETEGE